MKFALIYQVQLPKPWTDVSEYQLFQNILTQVNFAEEMGFEGVWFMEHHFAPEQSHSSAPDMILKGADSGGGDNITGRDLVEATRFPMGSPEDCIKFIEQFAAIGVEELMFNFQLGPVAHAEVMESIRLFGKQVIPYFRA